jgi:hypothetical protein
MEPNDPQMTNPASPNKPPSGARPLPSIWRRLLRRSWVIALAWVVLSVPLCLLIYFLFEPTYEAFSVNKSQQVVLEQQLALLEDRLKEKKKEWEKLVRESESEIDRPDSRNDAFNLALLNHELMSLLNMQDQKMKTLEQLRFESEVEQDRFRVDLQDLATVPKTPQQYLAWAPIIVFLAIFALMLVQEIKLGRDQKSPKHDQDSRHQEP